MVGDGGSLGYEHLKTIVCGIEGLYVPALLQDRQVQLLYIQEKESISNKVWNLGKKEDF